MPKMRSVEASRAVFNCPAKLSPSEVLMLQVLANHADENFECFPSLDRLAKMSRLSRRQTIRILHRLRDREVIHFEGKGGRQKSNRYKLLLTQNGDTQKGDIAPINSDIRDTETVTSVPETVTSAPETVTSATLNSDMVSPEWIDEGFEEFRNEWGNRAAATRLVDDAISEIEDFDPTELVNNILQGVPVTHESLCEDHGVFTRQGHRFGEWLAWDGNEGMYSSGWSADAGCRGCTESHEEAFRDRPEARELLPVRRFELRTPVACARHGRFILQVLLMEYGPAYERMFAERFHLGIGQYVDACPRCEAEWLHREEIRDALDLTEDQWERGSERILQALEYAQGE